MENWYKISQKSVNEMTLDRWDEDPFENVDSSFIQSIAYFPAAHVLEVKLKNGKRYTFMSVPEDIYLKFKQSPSKGKFFNEVIKKHFVQGRQ